jgi:hypothetical protein
MENQESKREKTIFAFSSLPRVEKSKRVWERERERERGDVYGVFLPSFCENACVCDHVQNEQNVTSTCI